MMPKNYKAGSQSRRRRSSTASSRSTQSVDSSASSAVSSSRTPSPPPSPKKAVLDIPDERSISQLSVVPLSSSQLPKPMPEASSDGITIKLADDELDVPGLNTPPEAMPGFDTVLSNPVILQTSPIEPPSISTKFTRVLSPPPNGQKSGLLPLESELEVTSATAPAKESIETVALHIITTFPSKDDVAMTSPDRLTSKPHLPETDLITDKRPTEKDYQEDGRNRPFRSRLPKHELIQPADNVTEALRVCIAARRHADINSRGERVERVLAANDALSDVPHPKPNYTTTINLINANAMLAQKGSLDNPVRQAAVKMVAAREGALAEKTDRLRSEYMLLHKKWANHCKRLDVAAAAAAATATATATSNNKASRKSPEDTLAPPTRTTRRSAAALGDAVRSDLEMEQIIASLGNDDLTDPNILASRNLAKIPDMISVVDRDKVLQFDDTTGLIRNPQKFYDVRGSIEDWSEDEKKIFVRKYALFPKQFGVIASFLEYKTTQDCILFYYVHKKELIDFRDAVTRWGGSRKRRKAGGGKQKGNALLADIASTRPRRRQQTREDGAAPLPIDSDNPRPRQRLRVRNAEKDQIDAEKSARRHAEAAEKDSRKPPKRKTTYTRTIDPDDDDDDGDETTPRKSGGRKGRKGKEDKGKEDEATSRGRRAVSSTLWNDRDKGEFLSLLPLYGTNWKRMSASMPNKTAIQLSSYYKMYCSELGLDAIAARAIGRSPSPDPPTIAARGIRPPASDLPSSLSLGDRERIKALSDQSIPGVTIQRVQAQARAEPYAPPPLASLMAYKYHGANGPPQLTSYVQWPGQTQSSWSSMHTGPLPDVNPTIATFVSS